MCVCVCVCVYVYIYENVSDEKTQRLQTMILFVGLLVKLISF